jgi:hypothetical protein
MVPLVLRLPSPKAPEFAQWCVSAGIAHGGFEHLVAHGVESPLMAAPGTRPPALRAYGYMRSRQSVHQNSGQATCRSLALRRHRPSGRSSLPRCLASRLCPNGKSRASQPLALAGQFRNGASQQKKLSTPGDPCAGTGRYLRG